MANESNSYFSTLVRELGQRAARAFISKFSPVSNPLRLHLHDVFERPSGEPGSFLADPLFEASFGWQQAPMAMQELAGNLLNKRLVKAMDNPPKELAEQKFGADWHPYAHQVTAWNVLKETPPRSIIVSSGTGSGKTECFLVPILSDLADQLDKKETLEGVQALMLYPLNALINSQRDRLRAWTSEFKGGIRYALYNGETPDDEKASVQAEMPEEVLSRKLLRSSPPPILVTNSTMLEYMLVRQQDNPIVEKSKGKLRWIVLDEAHTYIGSHAAEISLLLRRVLHAFGVEAHNVRFIATSATIGSAGDDNAVRQLQHYLADVAGIDPSRVSVVTGSRHMPPLDKAYTAVDIPLPPVAKLKNLDPAALYEVLSKSKNARTVRQALIDKGPMTITELTVAYVGKKSVSLDDKAQTLELLDLCRIAQREDETFIPLRGHLFHRTQSGIWACCNSACLGRKKTHLDNPEWSFGKIFMERHERCDAPDCGSRVYELVFCDSCGEEYLSAEENVIDEQSILVPYSIDTNEDDTEDDGLVDDENPDEKLEQYPYSFPRLITDAKFVEVPASIDRITGHIGDTGKNSIQLGLTHLDDGFRCRRCGQKEKRQGQLFRPARSGAAFHLLMSIPTLLEHTPPISDKASNVPFGGRRLITFSDSRQGTARFSLQSQLDAERNYSRSWLYHQMSANKTNHDPEELAKKKNQLEQLEGLYKQTPMEALAVAISNMKNDIESCESSTGSALPWGDSVHLMQATKVLQDWMPEQWKHTAFKHLNSHQIAQLCLIREFARRPKRQTSLETLGLVSLHYPDLDRIGDTDLPPAWKQRRLGVQDWRDFLKIAVDFSIRGACAVQVPQEHSRWIGIDLPTRFLIGPDEVPAGRWQIRWPMVRDAIPRSRLPILLFRALALSPEDRSDRSDVNELLAAAWTQIRTKLLAQEHDGFRLSLERKVEFKSVQNAWFCPVTRRVVDVTLLGWSPYTSMELPESLAKCTKIQLPELMFPFGRDKGESVPREKILDWLETDARIADLRKQGVWSSYSDRIATFSDFYRINEHSAQQNSTRLRKLEEGFKSAKINILSCSTTMEMGVDIGGVSCVAMNNAPPSPANYLQRAGRAGRRKESASVSFTLCQSAPHGESVFSNPAWPFRTPIKLPHVSLQSERIIQRHINALTLTRFLQQHAQDLTKLQCQWFFSSPSEEASSPANIMELWVQKHEERLSDTWLIKGLRRLSYGTALEGVEPTRLLEQVGLQLKRIKERWLEEENALKVELENAGGAPTGQSKASPAQLAILKQLKRIYDEYLLGELAASGFLPGYGFPTAVVPFINSTLETLRHDGRASNEREDNRSQRRGYPSRDLPMAIREYAPGSDIVIDGQVFTSEGVTLNWHVPAGDYTEAPELQSFKNAWRCRGCGSSGTRSTILHSCPVCGAESDLLVIKPYLQPAGFAVNIYTEPHNDLSYRKYMPVHKPWITAGQTPWSPLPRPELGRYRFSHEGHIFHQSGGLMGHGYAICLRCGRSASETATGGTLPVELQDHYRLRGGKEKNGQSLCPGNDQQWSIKRNQWLGLGVSTDVFELQLSDPVSGVPLNNDVAAYSLATALRQALAEELGINDREISCASIPSRTPTNQLARSIVLYDTSTGGAGFVAAAASNLPKLLERAREILTCKKNCDTACHSCLLTYDTQHDLKRLNRHEAMAQISPQLLKGLSLPNELHFFGPQSRLEFDELHFALYREMQRSDVDELRIYLGGNLEHWDFLDWPIRSSLLKWASEDRMVVLLAKKDAIFSLDSSVANPLASLIEAGGIQLREIVPQEDDLHIPNLIAEVGGAHRTVRWATTTPDCLTPSEYWARANQDDRCVKVSNGLRLSPIKGLVIDTGKVRRAPSGSFTELVITKQLDGPINNFGGLFWQQVCAKLPHLKERLEQKKPITSVEFRDKFFSSPMNVKLLGEVVKGLSAYFEQFDTDVKLVVETVDFVKQNYKPSELLHDDWQIRQHRNIAIELLLKASGGAVVVKEVPKYQAQHARDISILWSDGAKCTIRLDHGLSFMKSASIIPFNFNADTSTQVASLKTQSFNAMNRLGTTGTYIYLSDVHK
ncbi:MAG: DEAD/DEAH box helicase [Geobacteraceae bacterium]